MPSHGMTTTSRPRRGSQTPVQLPHGGGQVRQVLQHVDREDAVEVAGAEVQPPLAVAGDDV